MCFTLQRILKDILKGYIDYDFGADFQATSAAAA